MSIPNVSRDALGMRHHVAADGSAPPWRQGICAHNGVSYFLYIDGTRMAGVKSRITPKSLNEDIENCYKY